MFELVRNNINYRQFWYGQTISQLGDRIHTLAVIWLVYSWYNSGAAVGIVLIATTLPAFLVSPFAGNLLDKYDRKKIMLVCDFIRSFFVLLLALLTYLNLINIYIIILFTIIISIGAAFFNPATMSIMPSLVKKEDLTQANAFYQISVNSSSALGFMLGSGLIALIGIPIAFLINGFSFLFSAYFLFRLHYEHIPTAFKTNIMQDFTDGWKIIKGIPLIFKLFLPVIIINFFLSALFILIPVFAEGVFKKGSTGLGIMMTGLTIGMLLGSIIMSNYKLKFKPVNLIFPPLVLISLSFLFMSLFENYYLYLVLLAFIGSSLTISNIVIVSLLQKFVPNDVRGKVFGLLTAASVSLQPISYGLMGFLTEIVQSSIILMICSSALILTAFWIYKIKELKEI
jgi:DHA3 family macrolide efflux protein-like MFS transporter